MEAELMDQKLYIIVGLSMTECQAHELHPLCHLENGFRKEQAFLLSKESLGWAQTGEHPTQISRKPGASREGGGCHVRASF